MAMSGCVVWVYLLSLAIVAKLMDALSLLPVKPSIEQYHKVPKLLLGADFMLGSGWDWSRQSLFTSYSK